MKGLIICVFAVIAVFFGSCSKKNRISPVTGTINGIPAITLYGSSYAPTDYILIDTIHTDKKISYEGTVFNYIYLSATSDNIFINGAGTAAARGSLYTNGTTIVLTIDTSYNITFASKLYTSN